jgi:exonuclease VII small subunit
MNEGMENLKEIEGLEADKRRLNKIVDKLEQRISTLEKVVDSFHLTVLDNKRGKK